MVSSAGKVYKKWAGETDKQVQQRTYWMTLGMLGSALAAVRYCYHRLRKYGATYGITVGVLIDVETALQTALDVLKSEYRTMKHKQLIEKKGTPE